MSKVGNLRAMFENKGETSPPERGRSPGLSTTGSGTESPRPLSKIRTNFVAIEKDGRIGLQRDPSTDSVLSTNRKTSGEAEGDAASVSQEKPPSFADRIQKSTKPSLQMETIPQSPQHDPSSAPQSTPQVVKAAQGQATRPEAAPGSGKGHQAEGQAPAAVPPKQNTAAAKTKPDQSESINGSASAVERDKAKAAPNKKPPSKEQPKTTVASSAATSATKPVAKLSAISTVKAATKPPAKSPTVTKTPTSPTKVLKLPSKTPEKKALHPEKTATPKAAATSTSAHTPKATLSATRHPPALQISPSNSLDRGVGFVKPKPKSPTRPVTLPSGLTTHTAASATRVNPQRQSLSRQSGTYHTVHSLGGRSPSRASVSTVGGGGTLKRQSSTINRPRPSLGPPPKQVSRDHPVTRREKEVDESFLARMMRPTQASSSKTQEKPPTTPPRKTAVPTVKRPATNKEPADAAKKVVAKAEAAVKKVVPKTVPAAVGKKGESNVSKEGSKENTKPGQSAELKSVSKDIKEKEVAKETATQPQKLEQERVALVLPEEEGDKTVEPTAEPVEAAKSVEDAKGIETAVGTTVGTTVETATAQDSTGSECVSTADAPLEASGPSAVNGAQEETASEADLAEPDTPSEGEAVIEKSAVPQADGSEEKLAGENLSAEETGKQEDESTIAE